MSEDAPARKPGLARRLGCSVVSLLCLLFLVFFSPLGLILHIWAGTRWCEWRNEGEFHRNKDSYENLVRAIQGMNLQIDRAEYFRLDPDKKLATSQPVPDSDRGDWNNLVIARRSSVGRLTLKIHTYDMGHAGTYGLYYSSGPPSQDELKYSFGADGRVAGVAPGWWRVSDYSQ